jgi:hypothetical protein
MPTAKSRSGATSAAAPKQTKPPRPTNLTPAPSGDFAKDQIARLERLLETLMQKAHEGELGAIDRILKVLERIDRYRGFASSNEPIVDEENARTKILQKLAEVDARRAAAREMIAAGELPDVPIGG